MIKVRVKKCISHKFQTSNILFFRYLKQKEHQVHDTPSLDINSLYLKTLLERTRIAIPIIDVLLDILLLAREEVPAHSDAHHAVVILDGMPLLAAQYRVVDGFKLIFGIVQEPIARGSDAPIAILIKYRKMAGWLIPIVVRSLWLLRHDIANVVSPPLTLAEVYLISERYAPLVVLADDTTACGIPLEGTIQANLEQLTVERLDADAICQTIHPHIIGVLVGLH